MHRIVIPYVLLVSIQIYSKETDPCGILSKIGAPNDSLYQSPLIKALFENHSEIGELERESAIRILLPDYRFFNDEEKADLEMHYNQLKGEFTDSSGKVVDTQNSTVHDLNESKKTNEALLVVDKNGRFYLTKNYGIKTPLTTSAANIRKSVSHLSLTQGEDVLFAGKAVIEKGKLKKIIFDHNSYEVDFDKILFSPFLKWMSRLDPKLGNNLSLLIAEETLRQHNYRRAHGSTKWDNFVIDLSRTPTKRSLPIPKASSVKLNEAIEPLTYAGNTYTTKLEKDSAVALARSLSQHAVTIGDAEKTKQINSALGYLIYGIQEGKIEILTDQTNKSHSTVFSHTNNQGEKKIYIALGADLIENNTERLNLKKIVESASKASDILSAQELHKPNYTAQELETRARKLYSIFNEFQIRKSNSSNDINLIFYPVFRELLESAHIPQLTADKFSYKKHKDKLQYLIKILKNFVVTCDRLNQRGIKLVAEDSNYSLALSANRLLKKTDFRNLLKIQNFNLNENQILILETIWNHAFDQAHKHD